MKKIKLKELGKNIFLNSDELKAIVGGSVPSDLGPSTNCICTKHFIDGRDPEHPDVYGANDQQSCYDGCESATNCANDPECSGFNVVWRGNDSGAGEE